MSAECAINGMEFENDPWRPGHARRRRLGRAAQGHLGQPDLKKKIKLLWFSTGKEDRLITNTRSTVELLKKHGFEPVFLESPGAHVWINWRNYLGQFAPQLFQ